MEAADFDRFDPNNAADQFRAHMSVEEGETFCGVDDEGIVSLFVPVTGAHLSSFYPGFLRLSFVDREHIEALGRMLLEAATHAKKSG